MRHSLRRSFNLCAAVSAVLFVGVCVLWVRSYRSADALEIRDRTRTSWLLSASARVGWCRLASWLDPQPRQVIGWAGDRRIFHW